MKKWLAWMMLVVVLEIPLEIWQKMPNHEREMVRTLTIEGYCVRESEKSGVRKFRIWEDIQNGMWRLHIDKIHMEV